MTSNVNSIITSGDLGGGLIPTEYATQIIQDAPKSSVSLTRMRQIRMSTRTRTQPVLDSKPIAYWVGGDTGLKQTTKMKWSGLSITAEELAAIVPIPEAVIAASGIPFGHSWHNTKTPSVVRNGLSAVTMPSRSVAVLINPQWGRETRSGR